MSYASQIISSVNNKSDDSESIISNTQNDESISQSRNIVSNDNDVGYKTNINDQVKTTVSNKSSKATTAKSSLINYIFPFTFFSNFAVLIVLLLSMLLILRYYNVKTFGSLGDVMDNVVEILYDIFESLYELMKPLINTVYALIYGSSNELAVSSATGVKKSANTQSEIVDKLTDPILNEDDNNKINITNNLKNDINNKKNKSITIERDDIDSTIQKKTNWCYIGEDQGIRKCAMIGDSKCMSGLVYESNEKCMNNIIQ